MLRRASAGRALWALDFDGTARARLGRPFLCALGIPGGVLWPAATSGSYVHCAAGWDCAHAARALSHLHISGFVALVSGLGLSWDEAGRKLARAGKVFSQVRRRDRSASDGRSGLVCVESLA